MAQSSTEVVQARASLGEEMAAGDLGDARLNARRDRVLAVLEQAPEVGFPTACARDADTEALYRLFRNRRVSLAAILEPHWAATGARCRALDEVVVLHDTTEMAFAGGPRAGLTPLGPARQGFWVHTSLAVSAEGLRAPLGVIALTAWARPPRDGPPPAWRDRFRDPRKESRRWADGVAAARQRVEVPGRAIHVMDREGDSYELLATLIAHGDRCVVRGQYDRPVSTATIPGPVPLREVRAHLPVRFSQAVTVAPRRAEARIQRLAFPARDGRVAHVAVTACTVTVHRPRDHRHTTVPATVALQVVFAWEPDPPPGEPPVEWTLLTTEPIETVPQIRQVLEWYRTRWLIEDFFKCLKTGCAYEQRQLESLDTLLVALAFLVPIAWQLLLLRHLARACPETPATVALAHSDLALLRATPAGAQLPATPTVHDALCVVARLGGHLRQNGPPGWLVLARGMLKLRYMRVGWAAAEAAADK